jgi:hypothetical protein
MKYLYVFFFILLSCKSTPPSTTETPSASCGFERPPYVARALLKNGNTADAEILFFGLHAKPEKVVSELNQLDDVIEEVRASENLDKVIAIGDFNAGCSYLSESAYNALDLTTKGYNWVIPYSADTNVASSQCAYDRILTYGLPAPVTYNIFTTGITDQISDHYPIEAVYRFNSNDYKISAFNLQRFGPTKAQDSNFIDTVKNYIATQDIILLQEITTTDQSLVNLLVPTGYDLVVSERLGSTSYKEQYAYVFNNKIQILKDYVHELTNCTPTNTTSENQCTSDGYNCGSNPYLTAGGYCYATKDGKKVRTRSCCCSN